MNKKISTKELVTTALLIAIGILIPSVFTGIPFRWVIGPYSATLMAHVPVIIAMFISPWAALFTAVGTTIGFFFTAPIVVAVRAASHIVFALVGAYMIKKNCTLLTLCPTTGLIHAFFEGIVVYIFFTVGWSAPAAGYSVQAMTWITVLGTFLHHIVDFIIAYFVGLALIRAKAMPAMPPIWRKH